MEPKKYSPVAITPRACPPEEAEEHLRAFVRRFVARPFGERWLHILFERPDKASQALYKFEHHARPGVCTHVGSGAARFPASLAKIYGAQLGVYFNGKGAPIKVTAAEAATLATEHFDDAIFSLEAGRRALFFHHDAGLWVCEAR